jgi:colicin import membrane protein
MPAAVDRLQFAPPPPPGMLRALGLALIAHLLLVLALGWGINWKRDPVALSAEAELWSSVPQEAAPRLVEPTPPPPVPVPVPVPPPPPPPVVKAEAPKPEPAPREADIALEREKEKEKERKAEDRRKQLALEREKKREAEKQKQLEARREQEERRKEDLAKAKAADEKKKLETAKREKAEKAIEAQRQANIERLKGMAGATGPATATGTAQRSSGPSSSYAGRVAARVKPNIVFTDEISGNPRAEVEVRTAPDGTIVGQRILKSSGVKAWDDAVLKAVINTEVLPRDTDGRVPSPLIIDFRPRD